MAPRSRYTSTPRTPASVMLVLLFLGAAALCGVAQGSEPLPHELVPKCPDAWLTPECQLCPAVLRIWSTDRQTDCVTCTCKSPDDCPAPRDCDCKDGHTEAMTIDGRGCKGCICVAPANPPATTTGGAKPATTTAAAGTTTRCPPKVPCHCPPSSFEQTTMYANGCSSCRCVMISDPDASTTAAAAAHTTTAKGDNRPETTGAPVTKKPPTCPPPRPCSCGANAKAHHFVTDAGCASCVCRPNEEERQTTLPPTPQTRAECPKFKAKKCKCDDPDAKSEVVTGPDGCPMCACVSDPDDNNGGVDCSTRTACLCKEGAVSIDIIDPEGCSSCRCVVAEPCPTPHCKCSAGEKVLSLVDERGCESCQCVPDEAHLPTTARATPPPMCPVPDCACLTDEFVGYYEGSDGCQRCQCMPKPTQEATTGEPRPECANIARCRCDASRSEEVWELNELGCQVCYCQRKTTDGDGDGDEGSDPSPEDYPEHKPVCPAVRCECGSTGTAEHAIDDDGCPICTCKPNSETAVIDCAAPRACNCQNGGVSVWRMDATGCPVCSCQRHSAAIAGSDSGVSERASSSGGGASAGIAFAVVALVAASAFLGYVVFRSRETGNSPRDEAREILRRLSTSSRTHLLRRNSSALSLPGGADDDEIGASPRPQPPRRLSLLPTISAECDGAVVSVSQI